MTDILNIKALEVWLADNIVGFCGPASITKFGGGQSNPTYLIDTHSKRYVLRRKPFGNLLPSAHAVDREYRLASTLWPLGFPVPRPIALCTDMSVIGSIFYIMQFAEGQIYWDGSLPQLSPTERRTVYEGAIDSLASLHEINVDNVGLEHYGKKGNYFERQVKRWTQQYRSSETETIREMEYLIEWLPGHIPPQQRISIVHGDYRIDNIIFAKNLEVNVVIDWELSTIGDPLADFAYFAMQWVLPFDGGPSIGDLELGRLGIPSLDDIIERYCTKTNRNSLPNLDWYFAYNLFRIAGIVQGIKKRMLGGNASHIQAHEPAAKVPFFAKTAWEFALKFQA